MAIGKRVVIGVGSTYLLGRHNRYGRLRGNRNLRAFVLIALDGSSKGLENGKYQSALIDYATVYRASGRCRPTTSKEQALGGLERN